MLDSKKLSARRFIVLKRILSVLGCIVFLFSIIFPFFSASYPNSIVEEDLVMTEFWFFKSHTRPLWYMHRASSENWFLDYWVKESAYRSEFSFLFPLVFVSQLLTLFSGVASVQVRKRLLICAPIIFCSIIIVLMTYISMNSKIYWRWQYQEGFWLAFPSLFLFLSAFVLNEIIRREKTRPKKDTVQSIQSGTIT